MFRWECPGTSLGEGEFSTVSYKAPEMSLGALWGSLMVYDPILDRCFSYHVFSHYAFTEGINTSA